MSQEVWERVCLRLAEEIGQDATKNWIAPLKFVSEKEGIVTVEAPTRFFGNWVARNFGDKIKMYYQIEAHAIDRLSIAVANKGAQSQKMPGNATPDTPSPQISAKSSVGHTTARSGTPLSASDRDFLLNEKFTFDNFVVGKPNELAHAAARRVAEGAEVTFNPLFLYGGVGLGKTHLMNAIAWELRARFPQRKVLYLSAEQFMFRFIQAMRFKNTIPFKELFRSVDVLMVDDVQFFAGKDSTQEEFFHTFNTLISQNKQIIISADRSPGEIDGLEDRIKSRLQWGLVVDMHPTDFELRMGILQSKAEYAARQFPGVEIDESVFKFVAHKITQSVRELEGALTRLYAHGSLIGKRVGIEMAQDILSDLLRDSERRVTLDDIVRKVSEHYSIRMTDFLSHRRARAIARPRQMAMYLAKTLTTKSLPEIGRHIGGRDHTTVIHAVKKIEELKATDSQLAADLDHLRRILEG